MKILKILAVFLTVVLVGCAGNPQSPVRMSQESWQADTKIGVAVTTLPKVTTRFPGADCLLCYAAASVAHAKLTKHVESLTVEELLESKQIIAKSLRDSGVEVVMLKDSIDISKLPKNKSKLPNSSKKNFSGIKKEFGIDKLVVIDINTLGVHRNYSTYVPTSDPQAVVLGAGYMINLENNIFEWYEPINVYYSAEGEWDEPPAFPGITNAYYQALEKSKDKIIKPFSELLKKQTLAEQN